ncbi:MAG: phosphoheptose isomerase [Acidobacteria bacterium RIFCSPLOWO2_02_FULL_68_18]|nr:MAG: phosphoheptose isomerase [Acidobacteria bacterium RIFCSPLOWO2_02_FULL_68_18]OFW51581.1 MAG: phosphoheptose isomerase [Acidobacteria bacterium RIFCSPLOWO2_12_FULL_68_19]
MSASFTVAGYLDAHSHLAGKLDLEAVQTGVDVVRAAFEAGRQIITCGNGGSAYAASHFITDWNKMVNLATGRKCRGMSLCDNIGLVTAFANDAAFDEIFAGQLRAILEPGDLVIAVSGSGNSPNVVRAVEYANAHGAETLAVVGYDGGRLKQTAKHAVWIPSFDMQLCEEFHLMFGHMVMKALCGARIED